MFKRFKINKNSFDGITFNSIDRVAGKKISNDYSNIMKDELSVKFKNGNIIDGSATQRDWFPNIKCDIFLSHSHRDLDRAQELAGWIKNKFNLKVFIDYNIWGNVNDLLREIDDEYCYNKETKTYSYEKRNITTSHAHMMLINALAEMIDKTECLIFLETPNSVSIKKMLHETESPWIYSELFLSKIVRISDNLIRKQRVYFSKALRAEEGLKESFKIKHEVDISHLIEISGSDLNKWRDTYFKEKERDDDTHPLDVLYLIKKQYING